MILETLKATQFLIIDPMFLGSVIPSSITILDSFLFIFKCSFRLMRSLGKTFAAIPWCLKLAGKILLKNLPFLTFVIFLNSLNFNN